MCTSSTVTGSRLCFFTVVDGRMERIHVCILYSNWFLSAFSLLLMDGWREYMCASSTVTSSCLCFFTVVDGRMERIHVCILYSNWYPSILSHCC